MRIGTGFDAHRFTEGCPLVLAGATIPFPYGLEGHSDADVICHALIDAIFGAAADGDIGTHFPDTDPKYQDILSLDLVVKTIAKLHQRAHKLVNVDLTVILEEPKIAPFRDEMLANLSGALGLDKDLIGLKATTTEGLGFTGRREGIAAQAVVLLDDSRAPSSV